MLWDLSDEVKDLCISISIRDHLVFFTMKNIFKIFV